MGVTVDPVRLAQLDKATPLRARGYRGEQTTCAICGADILRDEWAVTLPERLGVAQPGCAADAGFSVD